MANRILFSVTPSFPHCDEHRIEFKWHAGLNISCRQRSLEELNNEIHKLFPDASPLDISAASPQEGGAELAALAPASVSGETAPDDDPVLHRFLYSWQYCRALKQAPALASILTGYDSFTDIMTPSDRETPARAAAVYEGLRRAGMLGCLDDFEAFRTAVTSGSETAADRKVTPAAEEAAPVSEEPASAAEEPVAAVEETAPAAEESAPAAEESAPAAEETAPAAEESAPAAEEVVPAENIPTVEETAPIRTLPVILGHPVPDFTAFRQIIDAKSLGGIMTFIGKQLQLDGDSCSAKAFNARELVASAYREALQNNLFTLNTDSVSFPLKSASIKLTPDSSCTGGFRFFFDAGLNAPAAPAEAPAEPPAEAPAEVPTEKTADAPSAPLSKPAAEITPVSYLEACDFQILSEATPVPAQLIVLAKAIRSLAERPLGRCFLQFLRSNIGSNNSGTLTFSFSNTFDSIEKTTLGNLAKKMYKLGLFRTAYLNFKTNTLSYSLPDIPFIRNFLMGGWLELALSSEIGRIAGQIGREFDLPVHTCSNLQLSQGNSRVITHELDAAVSVGPLVFIFEMKSSAADYERFRIVGNDLGILPDRMLLVNSSLTPEEAEVIDFIYPYHAAALRDTESAAEQMFRSALLKEGFSPTEPAAA